MRTDTWASYVRIHIRACVAIVCMMHSGASHTRARACRVRDALASVPSLWFTVKQGCEVAMRQRHAHLCSSCGTTAAEGSGAVSSHFGSSQALSRRRWVLASINGTPCERTMRSFALCDELQRLGRLGCRVRLVTAPSSQLQRSAHEC